MTAIAQQTGLSRESLDRAFSKRGKSWCCNPEVAEQDESDGFVPVARRKPQRRLGAFARFATPPWVRRRAFMFRYFRVCSTRVASLPSVLAATGLRLSVQPA